MSEPIVHFLVSKHSLQGRRPYQEDRILASFLSDSNKDLFQSTTFGKNGFTRCSLFVVCDGHSGDKCAKFIVNNVEEYVWQALNLADLSDCSDKRSDSFITTMKNCLTSIAQRLDMEYLEIARKTREKDGSCLLICLVLDNQLYFINVGDCRATRINGGNKATQITRDHRPGLSREEDCRIKSAGGGISEGRGEKRVIAKGMKIAVSRAIGDRLLKGNGTTNKRDIISSDPDLFSVKITDDLKYVCLMSDGVTSRCSNKKMAEVIRRAKMADSANPNPAKALVDWAYNNGSMDNISAIVLQFTH